MNKKVKKLQEKLKDRNLDGVVIFSRPNTIYFSGFLGTTSVILITFDEAIFATDFRYLELATGLCSKDFTIEKATVGPGYIGEKIKELGLQTVGFEDESVSYSMLMHWAEQAPNVEFVGIESDIKGLRRIKTSDEIALLQKAVDIGDAAFSHILELIKPGVTEIEIAAELEYFMRKSGALKPSFETISVSGTKTSMPHGMPDDKKIELGDPVTMDFGCVYKGYCSDMTRTVFVGNPSDKMRDIYNLVLRAQVESQQTAYAGMTGIEVDAIARRMIYSAGFEGCFDHGLGHSVGIDIHEEPRFNTKDSTVMENNMIMTVEPGVYVAGLGGVRIENMIVINDDKPISLTKSTKELIIL